MNNINILDTIIRIKMYILPRIYKMSNMKSCSVLLNFIMLLNYLCYYTHSFSRGINIITDRNRNHELLMILDSSNSKYRNAQPKDLEQIARLVSNTFDGPYQIHQIFEKEKDYQISLKQFKGRYEELIIKKVKNHAMIVATLNNTVMLDSNNNDIVQGFLEIGLLPSPIPVNVTLPIGVTLLATTDQPYLGNIAVDPLYHRQGIASKLIKISEKIAQKWGNRYIFAGVDCDNSNAINMYTKLGYSIVLDERDMINRKLKQKPRLFIMKQFDNIKNIDKQS